MALTQVASGLIASVSASTLTGTQTIPKATLPTGSVLQVVSVSTQINTQTSSTSYIDSGVSLSITPTSATSKILVLVNMTGIYKNTANIFGLMRLVRNSTELIKMEGAFGYEGTSNENNVGATSACHLDTPATTSSTTYKTQISVNDGSGNIGIGRNGATSTITLMEISA
jgi:hypothetical protein